MPVGCSILALGVMVCRLFNALEVLPESRYTIETFELQLDSDVSKKTIIIYDLDIWPLLRDLWIGQKHYLCQNSICTMDYIHMDSDMDYESELVTGKSTNTVFAGNTTPLPLTAGMSDDAINTTPLPPTAGMSDVAIILTAFGTILTMMILFCIGVYLKKRRGSGYEVNVGEGRARYDTKTGTVVLELSSEAESRSSSTNPMNTVPKGLIDVGLPPEPLFRPRFAIPLVPNRMCSPPPNPPTRSPRTPRTPRSPTSGPPYPIATSTPCSGLEVVSVLSTINETDFKTPSSLAYLDLARTADTIQHGEGSSTWTGKEDSQDGEIVFK